MREGSPSFTAALVSFGRGVGAGAPPLDPYSGRLLPGPVGAALRVMGRPGRPTRAEQAIFRALSFGLVDHVCLRTAAIDAAVREAAPWVAQCVLLGAGLDTRAHRLPSLAEMPVFEVDHPDTQRFKRRRMEKVTDAGGAAIYVPVDFAVDALDEALERAGHRSDEPTLWVWEGVTMYLPRAATEASLYSLSSRSSKGSRLVVSYLEPEDRQLGPFGPHLIRAFFGGIGEPIRGRYDPSDFASLLGAHGFEVRSDTRSKDWAKAHAGNARLAFPFASEHLTIAERP